MFKRNNSLMLAYIIFLAISLLLNILGNSLNLFNFSAWNKIVIATTISTYFFTLASGEESIKNFMEFSYTEEEKLSKRTICNLEKTISLTNESSQKDEDILTKMKEELKKLIESRVSAKSRKEKETKDCNKKIFCLYTLGFIVFFVIACFDNVHLFFANLQDVCTMGAFILMLATDYFSDIKKKKFMEETDFMNDILDMIESHED